LQVHVQEAFEEHLPHAYLRERALRGEGFMQGKSFIRCIGRVWRNDLMPFGVGGALIVQANLFFFTRAFGSRLASLIASDVYIHEPWFPVA
jgi:hypothetical protein